MTLTELQQQAVTTLEKGICVSAGAGSGKTSVLVERCIRLILDKAIPLDAILALTFTEKAANQMKERLVREFLHRAEVATSEPERRQWFVWRQQVENAAIGTIHSFCARLLRDHAIEAGVDPSFTVLEAGESTVLKQLVLERVLEAGAEDPALFDLLKAYGEDKVGESLIKVYDQLRALGASIPEAVGQTPKVPKAEDAVSSKEQRLIEWDRHVAPRREAAGRLLLAFDQAYAAAKAERAYLDFDDLLVRAKTLLAGASPMQQHVRSACQAQFQAVLVDEFQDTNRLQTEIIDLLARPEQLFIVGDLKQSIYGFRYARPDLFQAKATLFAGASGCERVLLNENFRSRPELVRVINAICGRLLQDLGYEPLIPKREAAPSAPSPMVEVAAVPQAKGSKDEARVKEAQWVAQRIQALVASGDCAYRDVVLLFRTMSALAIYEQALRDAEVPYFVARGRGFYEKVEILDLVNALTLLDDPQADIPLAGVLRSPLVGASDDALFWLGRYAKQERVEGPLWVAIEQVEQIPELAEADRTKLEQFHAWLGWLRPQRDQLTISELLAAILEVTRYEEKLLAEPDARRKRANVRKLAELARAFEEREFVTLADFIHHLRELEVQEVRESEAQVALEAEDVVRLMTVHQAKGLEWPVVFIVDAGSRLGSVPGSLLSYTETYGLGIVAWNPKTRLTEATWTSDANARLTKEREQAEAKRVLYVAMTRAKDRLVMSGVLGARDWETSWLKWLMAGLPMPPGQAEEAVDLPLDGVPVRVVTVRDRLYTLVPRQGSRWIDQPTVRDALLAGEPVSLDPLIKDTTNTTKAIGAAADRIERQLVPQAARYPEFVELAVWSVIRYLMDPVAFEWRDEFGLPEWGLEKGPGPFFEMEEEPSEERGHDEAARTTGVLFHLIMERYEFDHPWEAQRDWIERLVAPQPDEQRATIAEMVQELVASPMGRVLAAVQRRQRRTRRPVLLREYPFVYRLDHGLVKGTLDLAFQEPSGRWVIADYKTGADPEKLDETKRTSYNLQLACYALALRAVCGLRVAEGRLVFVSPRGCAVMAMPLPAAHLRATERRVRQALAELSHRRTIGVAEDMVPLKGIR